MKANLAQRQWCSKYVLIHTASSQDGFRVTADLVSLQLLGLVYSCDITKMDNTLIAVNISLSIILLRYICKDYRRKECRIHT
jgi:hypothetical protein